MNIIIPNPLNIVINTTIKKPDWVDCDYCIIIDPIKKIFKCSICTKGKIIRYHTQKDLLENLHKNINIIYGS
jgi:hypothetical protein